LKEETLDHTPWGTRFGREYGPVVRQQNRRTLVRSQASLYEINCVQTDIARDVALSFSVFYRQYLSTSVPHSP